jgi:hypothetical protein
LTKRTKIQKRKKAMIKEAANTIAHTSEERRRNLLVTTMVMQMKEKKCKKGRGRTSALGESRRNDKSVKKRMKKVQKNR